MHNAAFRAMGLDAVYLPLEATSVDDADRVATALGISGMSVTAPLKVGWTNTPDDEASRALGAVNTLKRGAAGWLGRNVDGDGFLDPLDARGIALKGRRSVVLGAGGAARAVAHALVSRGSKVSICARRPEEAAALAGVIGGTATEWPLRGEWDVVVNATPLGTWPNEAATPVDMHGLRAGLVYDLVYCPEATATIRQAQAAGIEVIGGLEMLVGQAIRQCAWWTGQTPPAGIMAAAARAWISTDRNKGEQ
jgi:shikimate dehydrogenase